MPEHRAQPILYSFRRCPYAIRARLAIACAATPVELREVLLRDKPADMLRHSPKGTVPVLLLPDGSVLEQSLDIMYWALRQHDPDHWLPDNADQRAETSALIDRNDGEFKTHLDHYKYAVRHPEHPPEHYRTQAKVILNDLNTRLTRQPWLIGQQTSLADIALLPFIRQFAYVDKHWFDQAPYPGLQRWLQSLLETPRFQQVMHKQPAWSPGDPAAIFPTPAEHQRG